MVNRGHKRVEPEAVTNFTRWLQETNNGLTHAKTGDNTQHARIRGVITPYYQSAETMMPQRSQTMADDIDELFKMYQLRQRNIHQTKEEPTAQETKLIEKLRLQARNIGTFAAERNSKNDRRDIDAPRATQGRIPHQTQTQDEQQYTPTEAKAQHQAGELKDAIHRHIRDVNYAAAKN